MKILKNNFSIGSKIGIHYAFLELLAQNPSEKENIITEIRTLECMLNALSTFNVKIGFPPDKSSNSDLEIYTFFEENAEGLFNLIASDNIKAYAKICKNVATELKKDGALKDAVECEKMFEQLLKDTINFLKTQYKICKKRNITLVLPAAYTNNEDLVEPPGFNIEIQKQKPKEIELDF